MLGGRIIRRARPDEATLLSDLALRSKGYWGYSPEFLAACRIELTIAPERIARVPVFVAEQDGRVTGFYALDDGTDRELDDLFVEPEAIGRGHGAALLRHAIETARSLGWEALRIESDPNAEPFYLAMGAERVGGAPSGSIPGRVIPLLRLPLTPSPAASPTRA